ncbi:MAG: DUF1573 domain-containing protein [Planctomycetota bacterium]
MARLLWHGTLAVLWMLSPVGVVAQEYGPKGVPARLQGKLHIPEPVFEWGEVLQGTQVEHTFTLENQGSAVLKILNVKPSCGCTTVQFDREIPPGGVGQLQLRIRTDRISTGHTLKKRVTVHTNDPQAAKVILSLSGSVLSIIETDPSFVRLEGLYGEPKEGVVSLKRGSGVESFQLDEVRAMNNKVEITEIEELQEGQQYRVHLRAPGVTRPQILRETLRLTLRTPDGEVRNTTIPVQVQHLDRITLSPAGSVIFPRTETRKLLGPGAKPVLRPVYVNASMESFHFQIREVRLEGVPEGLFDTEVITVKKMQRYRVDLRLRHFQKGTRTVTGKLIIVTDDPRMPEREVRIFAQFSG